MKMFRVLSRRENIMTRLIEFFDGERRITNILHLSEILQKKGMESKADAEDLLNWFERQLDPFMIRKKEEQLRLESDENAVRIITIHKSKGLEFPVVFCPFLFGNSRLRNNAPVLFHDDGTGRNTPFLKESLDVLRFGCFRPHPCDGATGGDDRFCLSGPVQPGRVKDTGGGVGEIGFEPGPVRRAYSTAQHHYDICRRMPGNGNRKK